LSSAFIGIALGRTFFLLFLLLLLLFITLIPLELDWTGLSPVIFTLACVFLVNQLGISGL